MLIFKAQKSQKNCSFIYDKSKQQLSQRKKNMGKYQNIVFAVKIARLVKAFLIFNVYILGSLKTVVLVDDKVVVVDVTLVVVVMVDV